MNVVNVKENINYLREYAKLCKLEWGELIDKQKIEDYIDKKIEQIINEDKVISIIGITEDDILVGFISLFKYDGVERTDLTPWYATMYVKKEYRKKGYSKILNDLIIKEAEKLGYERIYLKSELKNYYEKFGAKYIEMLNNGEQLFYIDCKKI